MVCASLFILAGPALGAARGKGECSYTPLQEFIRSVRSEAEIRQLIDKQVNLNVKPKCGGSIMQLAIQRGNPQVVKALLEANVDIESNVSLDSFPIQGAPKEIPLLMFAAYYSPRPEIISLLMQAGVDVSILDSNGENVLWYMRQNPVLRDTDIYDEVNAILLYQTKNFEKGKSGVTGQTQSVSSNGKTREIVEPDLKVDKESE